MKTRSKSQKPKFPKKMMPHFGKAPAELVSVFETALKDIPMAERRQVFGSPAALVNGNLFTGLHNDKMILRVSDADAAALMQKHNAQSFEPMPGRAMKGWVALPPRLLNSTRELDAWMQRAFEHAQALPPKKK